MRSTAVMTAPSRRCGRVLLAGLSAGLMAAQLLLAGCARPGVVDPAGGAPPAMDDAIAAGLPNDKHGELVRQGWQIFTDTPRFARVYAGNALNCSSCHLDSGRRAGAAPMSAAWGMYPAYLAKSDKVATVQERIQQCFRFSMNGLAPPLDSHEMQALSAYMQWLARGVPVGVEQPGRGFLTIERTGSDPNPLRGKALYAQRCATCHGDHGQGIRSSEERFVAPPLWGAHSFNKGSGMNRIDLLAGFLKANMPLNNADLSDQEALDLAAWVTLQERWPDPRKGLVAGLMER